MTKYARFMKWAGATGLDEERILKREVLGDVQWIRDCTDQELVDFLLGGRAPFKQVYMDFIEGCSDEEIEERKQVLLAELAK